MNSLPGSFIAVYIPLVPTPMYSSHNRNSECFRNHFHSTATLVFNCLNTNLFDSVGCNMTRHLTQGIVICSQLFA